MILRCSRMRVAINPNSRSPCADWFRFMKFISMVDQGNCSLNCVCRCSSGLSSERRPAIHMRPGEKVCIQVISPMQFRERLASRHNS